MRRKKGENKPMRKRMKRLLCLILSLTAAAGLMLVRDSAAWFDTQTGSPLGQDINVKKVNFTFQGNLGSYLQYDPGNQNSFFIITDTNLIKSSTGKLSGTNFSTIPTEVRFQVAYKSPVTGNSAVYSGSSDILTVTAASGWSYNTTDQYFYYYNNGSYTLPADATSSNTGTTFDLLNGIQFSEEALTNANLATTGDIQGGLTGKIVVAIQARQSDNMVWGDAAWTNVATIVSSS